MVILVFISGFHLVSRFCLQIVYGFDCFLVSMFGVVFDAMFKTTLSRKN